MHISTCYWTHLAPLGNEYQRRVIQRRSEYKHLFLQFENLVMKEDTFQPNDKIYVWSFNRRTKLLCEVEQKNFHTKLEHIRAEYKKELTGTNHRETRFYEVVATAVKTIQRTHKVHPKADFFLAAFTDGQNNSLSESVSLNNMMDSITNNSLVGRLHTFFITVNMPSNSDLFVRLKSQQNEISMFHNCENAEPNEITRAFNTLRECIKACLLFVYANGNEIHLTRIANYGSSKQEVAEKMMQALAGEMQNSSFMEAWTSLRSLGPP